MSPLLVTWFTMLVATSETASVVLIFLSISIHTHQVVDPVQLGEVRDCSGAMLAQRGRADLLDTHQVVDPVQLDEVRDCSGDVGPTRARGSRPPGAVWGESNVIGWRGGGEARTWGNFMEMGKVEAVGRRGGGGWEASGWWRPLRRRTTGVGGGVSMTWHVENWENELVGCSYIVLYDMMKVFLKMNLIPTSLLFYNVQEVSFIDIYIYTPFVLNCRSLANQL
jgi:hypothetical protein